MFSTDKWLLQKVSFTRIYDITCSHHAAISLTLLEKGAPSPTPIWHCKTRLIQDHHLLVISQHLWDFFHFNTASVTDSYTIWNGHKAYVRGIFIQQGARAKKLYTLKLNSLLSEIHKLESCSKQNTTFNTSNKLAQLREELRVLLTQQYDKYLSRLKMQSYANSNRAGKYLANLIKAVRTKSRIAYLIHPTLHPKVTNPQEIADQFADYYSALYNLKDNLQTPQPKEEDMQRTLAIPIHVSYFKSLSVNYGNFYGKVNLLVTVFYVSSLMFFLQLLILDGIFFLQPLKVYIGKEQFLNILLFYLCWLLMYQKL